MLNALQAARCSKRTKTSGWSNLIHSIRSIYLGLIPMKQICVSVPSLIECSLSLSCCIQALHGNTLCQTECEEVRYFDVKCFIFNAVHCSGVTETVVLNQGAASTASAQHFNFSFKCKGHWFDASHPHRGLAVMLRADVS